MVRVPPAAASDVNVASAFTPVNVFVDMSV